MWCSLILMFILSNYKIYFLLQLLPPHKWYKVHYPRMKNRKQHNMLEPQTTKSNLKVKAYVVIFESKIIKKILLMAACNNINYDGSLWSIVTGDLAFIRNPRHATMCYPFSCTPYSSIWATLLSTQDNLPFNNLIHETHFFLYYLLFLQQKVLQFIFLNLFLNEKFSRNGFLL